MLSVCEIWWCWGKVFHMKHAVAYMRFLILNEILTQDINKEVQSRCFWTFRYLSLLLTVNVWGPAATAGLQCIAVEGNSKLLISGQELEVVSAPVCSPPSLVPWNSCVNSSLFAISSVCKWIYKYLLEIMLSSTQKNPWWRIKTAFIAKCRVTQMGI